MSIINEALKKTDKFIQEKAESPGTAAALNPTRKNYLFYLLIIVLGLFLGNTAFNAFTHKPKPKINMQEQLTQKNQSIPAMAAVKNVALPTAVQTPTAVVNLPAPAQETKEPKASFVLNGIFFSKSDGYALVNNKIVRQGDILEGATVKNITANSVELDDSGNTITLVTER